MAERYTTQDVFLNTNEAYKEYFRKRSVNYIRHYGTVEMKYPTEQQIAQMALRVHIWKTGDRFYKLAQKFYGDARYWWVIAWLNKTPTEAHIEFGDNIMVPLDLEVFLEIVES
jgi:nucleoid-associated protein YgaU